MRRHSGSWRYRDDQDKVFASQVLESVDMQIKENPHTSGQGSDMAKGLRKKLSSLEDVRKASQRR